MNQKLDGQVRDFSVLLSPTSCGARPARPARLLATEQLHAWQLPLDPAALIVAELANNAATHDRVPGRNFRLLLYVVGDTFRIEVTDTRGDRLPHAQHAAPGGEAGRGLTLVAALAVRWGVIQGCHPARRYGRSAAHTKREQATRASEFTRKASSTRHLGLMSGRSRPR